MNVVPQKGTVLAVSTVNPGELYAAVHRDGFSSAEGARVLGWAVVVTDSWSNGSIGGYATEVQPLLLWRGSPTTTADLGPNALVQVRWDA